MRVCLVYDCLYPYTVGGAERWYRNLAERLARNGVQVTYLTRRQWARGSQPRVQGVRVVARGTAMPLYSRGRRRLLPPIVFGISVLWHMVRHGREYDVVHSAAFPYFPLLAVALMRRASGYRLVVDWHEVWPDDYWREYLGSALGPVGSLVQSLCVRAGDRAFCFSRLHAERLRAAGFRKEIDVLTGEYAGAPDGSEPEPALPLVLFAGRHTPEKRVLAIPAAVAAARRRVPDLRCEIYGNGPDRPALLRAIEASRLDGAIIAPGFVPEAELDHAMRRALCMLLPSRREGYGLVVVEAAARGVPSVVVAGEDNAATELVDDGVNGFVAAEGDPARLADAIVRVHEGGMALRQSTARWFADNARRLSIDSSVATVAGEYAATSRRA